MSHLRERLFSFFVEHIGLSDTYESTDNGLGYFFMNGEVNTDWLKDSVDEATAEAWTKSFPSIDIEDIKQVGGEDEGRDYYSVMKFSEDDHEEVYVKFQGWYASYHGSEFESWKIVEPKLKTVTVYA